MASCEEIEQGLRLRAEYLVLFMSVLLLLIRSGVLKSIFTYNSAVTKKNRNLITGVRGTHQWLCNFYQRWGVRDNSQSAWAFFSQIVVMVVIWHVFDLTVTL